MNLSGLGSVAIGDFSIDIPGAPDWDKILARVAPRPLSPVIESPDDLFIHHYYATKDAEGKKRIVRDVHGNFLRYEPIISEAAAYLGRIIGMTGQSVDKWKWAADYAQTPEQKEFAEKAYNNALKNSSPETWFWNLPGMFYPINMTMTGDRKQRIYMGYAAFRESIKKLGQGMRELWVYLDDETKSRILTNKPPMYTHISGNLQFDVNRANMYRFFEWIAGGTKGEPKYLNEIDPPSTWEKTRHQVLRLATFIATAASGGILSALGQEAFSTATAKYLENKAEEEFKKQQAMIARAKEEEAKRQAEFEKEQAEKQAADNANLPARPKRDSKPILLAVLGALALLS